MSKEKTSAITMEERFKDSKWQKIGGKETFISKLIESSVPNIDINPQSNLNTVTLEERAIPNINVSGGDSETSKLENANIPDFDVNWYQSPYDSDLTKKSVPKEVDINFTEKTYGI